MTRLELARTEDREAAQAVNEAYASKDMQRVRLATEWHRDCATRRIEASGEFDRWRVRLAQRRLAEIHERKQQTA